MHHRRARPWPRRRAPARFVQLAAIALTAAFARAASADEVRGTRDPDGVRQTDHAVEVRLRPGSAEIVVRRRVENLGARHDQAVFLVDGPPGGAAIGLRTLGAQGGRPAWFEAELLDRDVAEARYRELTGVGHAIPKDPALLFWVGVGRLGLQVFPVAPGEEKTVEYTLVAPTHYTEGRHWVDLSKFGAPGPVTFSLRAPSGGRVFRGDEPVAVGEASRLEASEVSLERAWAPKLDGALGVVPISSERSLFRLRVEAARRLSSVPEGASLVVLIDASRSLGDEEVGAEAAVARAWLARFPRARAAVVPFDREPRPLSEGLVPAREAIRGLERASLVRRNGSHLDAALAHAARLFASAPAGSARRLLVLTDARTREALTPALVRKALEGTGALAHLVSVSSASEPSLTRDDDHAWAKALRATGGLAWSATAGERPESAALAAETFEELARPVRVHRFRLLLSDIDVRGAQSGSFDVPETLSEGEGLSFLEIVGGAPSRARAVGELWATPVRASFSPSFEENRLAAALACGNDLIQGLSEDEQKVLAYRGRAVSPVTSYLAIEPGVRPSTEGLPEELGSAAGSGVGGGGIGLRAASVLDRRGPDRVAFLREELRNSWRACGGAGGVELTIESTIAEVVDVRDVVASDPGSKRFEACLANAAWALELTSDFRSEHDSFAVSF